METDEAAKALSESSCGAMTAPAGCGKTQVIATAVARHGGKRELILTHTHAGIDALRSRLVVLGAEARRYHLDTIAGWSLRLALSFPKTAGPPTPKPRTNGEYAAVYKGAARLVAMTPIREILRASYSGVYVDEYQDCTLQQHALVLKMAKTLRCRIVGDPLQGIFGFGGNEVVDWPRDVGPWFENVPGPVEPRRWRGSNSALGSWLQQVRELLLNRRAIDLRRAPIRWLDCMHSPEQVQSAACMRAARTDSETVVAIRNRPWQAHGLSRRLRGRFSCIEPIATGDLFKFAVKLEAATGFSRAVAVLDFARVCMANVASELRTIRRGLEAGRVPRVRKHKTQLAALVRVTHTDGISHIEDALNVLAQVPGAFVHRRELLREMKRAIRSFQDGEAETLEEAAWIVRNRTRRVGRPRARCAVGTTLLVKGLEFHHAVVLDAEEYDPKKLYVALTRGSKSLTVVSKDPILSPNSAGV